MEQAYAQVLWQMIGGGTEPKKALHAIHAQLEAQGRQELMPRIARAFERLAAREQVRTTVTLTVADHAHEHTARNEAAIALLRLGIDEHGVETHVDYSLIGGWRLEGREQLIDTSHKKHLLAIYDLATHS